MPGINKAAPPKYRKQKGKSGDRAFVELNGHRMYLGMYGSSDSRERYGSLIAEWSNEAYQPARGDDLTVNELVAAFMVYARAYYHTPHQISTPEISKYADAVRPLVRL